MGGKGGGGKGKGGGKDKLTGGAEKANKKNAKNLADIKALFEGLNVYGDQKYGEALKSIEGYGAAQKADAQSLGRQQIAGGMQNLANMGLSQSTAANVMQRGVHSDTMRSMARVNEDIARMRSGLFTGQAGFRQQNIQGLAGILGGVKYEPGTNYLMETAKLGLTGAMFMCDRRVKENIQLIDIVAGPDGIPFGLYRWTYKQHPEAGRFEGVIAQEVRHLPNVVFESIYGILIVDADELKRQTGVEVKILCVGVASIDGGVSTSE